MTVTDPHEPLPWYVNGTLEPQAAAAFEGHLEACADCRRELGLLRQLKEELEAHGEALAGDHPTAERLVDALLEVAAEGPAAVRDPEVRRHLSLCATCAQEARWVLGEERAEARGTPPITAAAAGRRAAWPYLAAAALLALGIGIPLWMTAGRQAPPTGIFAVHFVEGTRRSAGETVRIDVPRGAESVHLFFAVDLMPEEFPATLRLEGPAGRLIHEAAGIEAGALHQGRHLFLTCRRADCPDGEYLARLRPAVAGGAPAEYRFTLASSPAP